MVEYTWRGLQVQTTILSPKIQIMNKRIALLFGLLAISYVLVSWIGSGSDAGAEAKVELSVIPMELDGWRGENVEIRDDTVQVLKANSFINRVYHDSSGREISMHIANWANAETISAAPHHPEICYPAAGWEIRERRTIPVSVMAGEFPIELISFQKGQQRVVSAHWFKVSDVYFVSYDGFQRQRHRFWGKKAWPNTTKFLLQTVAPSVDAAEDRLKNFAKLVADKFGS